MSNIESEKYFDSRTLTLPRADGCPVRGCVAPLQPPPGGKAVPKLCPIHQIQIHRKTFGYRNPLLNIRFERQYFRQKIRHNRHKAETHRFGYENSEDALTWNVFARLARTGRLTELASSLAQIELSAHPELYLWGLPIRLDVDEIPEPFETLKKARDKFEQDISRMQTEPDVMLYVPERCLILIEAKFMSGNTIAKNDAKVAPGEKPKSQAEILSRYAVSNLPPNSLKTDNIGPPFFSQLYRNLVFAIWMAQELNVEWRLVNLVSQMHHSDQQDPTQFIRSLLPQTHQKRFVRYDWERLFQEHVKGNADLDELAGYLQYKSANCEKGLAI